jgi:hypothetical protein
VFALLSWARLHDKNAIFKRRYSEIVKIEERLDQKKLLSGPDQITAGPAKPSSPDLASFPIPPTS